VTLEAWFQKFPWESSTQQKGLSALYQWVQKLPPELRTDDTRNACVAAWFIQKDHESNEWWAKTVGDQVSGLQDQIRFLQEEIREMKLELANLKKDPHT
jgi:hypothetical protein